MISNSHHRGSFFISSWVGCNASIPSSTSSSEFALIGEAEGNVRTGMEARMRAASSKMIPHCDETTCRTIHRRVIRERSMAAPPPMSSARKTSNMSLVMIKFGEISLTAMTARKPNFKNVSHVSLQVFHLKV